MSRLTVLLATLFVVLAFVGDAATVAVQQPKLLNLTQYDALPLPIKQLVVAHPGDVGSPWSWIKCEVCKKVIGGAESFVEHHGCLKFDAYAATLCEIAGIGPEDPLSDVCAAALIAGCPIIAHEIEKHITNPDTLCKDIHMC
jgi:hypothetical protein